MFQVYRDFEKEVNAVRSVDETRKLFTTGLQPQQLLLGQTTPPLRKRVGDRLRRLRVRQVRL